MVPEFHDPALAEMEGEHHRAYCVVPVDSGVRGTRLPRCAGGVGRARKHIARSRRFGERSHD